jgi:hypothetical protein
VIERIEDGARAGTETIVLTPSAEDRIDLLKQFGERAAGRRPLGLVLDRVAQVGLLVLGNFDELLEHVRKIDVDTADEIQSVATIRAIACRVKALSHVARDFAFDPESGVTQDEIAGLRRVVHDGAEYSAAMAMAERAVAGD